MAELRHSSSLGSRASSSPMKRDGESSPLVPDSRPGGGDDDGRHSARDRDRSFWNHLHPICPPHFADDQRVSPHNSRISMFLLLALALAVLVSIFAIVNRLNAPYLCKKDGIVLHCPRVKESPSLWENPYSATTSWKPCAERHHGGISGCRNFIGKF